MHSCETRGCTRNDEGNKRKVRESTDVRIKKCQIMHRNLRVFGPLPLATNMSSYAVIASRRAVSKVVPVSEGHRTLNVSIKLYMSMLEGSLGVSFKTLSTAYAVFLARPNIIPTSGSFPLSNDANSLLKASHLTRKEVSNLLRSTMESVLGV